MNSMHSFSECKNRAINELHEMSKRATQTTHFTGKNNKNHTENSHNFSPLNLVASLSNDEIIIVGLVLILSKDCSDYWLFLALLYILL